MDLAAVLTATYPDALWSESGNDYATLTWDESNAVPKPSLDELEAAWPSVRDAEAWDRVRAERDRRLAASDWSQMPDNALDAPTIAAWAAYRQELRDIPQTHDDPDSIAWPEAP